jgi:hypothetical protein
MGWNIVMGIITPFIYFSPALLHHTSNNAEVQELIMSEVARQHRAEKRLFQKAKEVGMDVLSVTIKNKGKQICNYFLRYFNLELRGI